MTSAIAEALSRKDGESGSTVLGMTESAAACCGEVKVAIALWTPAAGHGCEAGERRGCAGMQRRERSGVSSVTRRNCRARRDALNLDRLMTTDGYSESRLKRIGDIASCQPDIERTSVSGRDLVGM